MAGKKRFFRVWHKDIDDGFFVGWASAELLLWIVLQRRADADGVCYPGYADIVAKTGLSRASIQRAIKSLESRGVITVERSRKPDNQKAVNRYFLCSK